MEPSPNFWVSQVSMLFDAILVIILSLPSMVVALVYMVIPRPRKNIKNEIVLVTGSGQGLGRELALLFAHQGCEVVCVDVIAEHNEGTVRQILAQGGRARAYVCNVADREAVIKLGKEVGRVDILVNNAGIYPMKNLWNSSEEEMRMIVDINLFSQFWTVQAFLPGMKERNHGHVVCVSSVGALLGNKSLLTYCVSKFGLTGFMAALDSEIFTENKDIYCTTVYPFFLETRPEVTECVKSRLPPIPAKHAAEEIVVGVTQNLHSFTVPRSFEHIANLCRLLPRQFEHTLFKFFPVSIAEPKRDVFKEYMNTDILHKTGNFAVQHVS